MIRNPLLSFDHRYQYAKSNLSADAALEETIGDGSLDEAYTYDDLNRLTSSNEQSFGLDSVGNITSVTTGETTVDRASNAQNELVADGDNPSKSTISGSVK